MTRTRFTLDDLGGALSARALLSFLTNLPPESATALSMLGPDKAGWSRADMLMARLVEGVEELAWITACKGLRKSQWPKRPKRIPRPGVEDETERRIGRDPIPISDFDEWYGGDRWPTPRSVPLM